MQVSYHLALDHCTLSTVRSYALRTTDTAPPLGLIRMAGVSLLSCYIAMVFEGMETSETSMSVVQTFATDKMSWTPIKGSISSPRQA